MTRRTTTYGRSADEEREKQDRQTALPVPRWLTITHGAVTLLLSAVIAGATWVYTDYAGKQWKEMAETLKATNDLVANAQKQTDAALRSATAAEIGNRAYMGTVPRFDSETGKAALTIQNVGHTAATDDIEVQGSVEYHESRVGMGGAPVAGTTTFAWSSGSIDILPGGTSSVPIDLRPTEIPKIKANEVSLMIYGTIDYNNGFGRPKSEFCYNFIMGGWWACPVFKTHDNAR